MALILVAFILGAGIGFVVGRLIPRRVPAANEPVLADAGVVENVSEPEPASVEHGPALAAAAESPASDEPPSGSVEPEPMLETETEPESESEPAPSPAADVADVSNIESQGSTEAIDQRMGGVLAELERRYQGRRAEADEASAASAKRSRRRRG